LLQVIALVLWLIDAWDITGRHLRPQTAFSLAQADPRRDSVTLAPSSLFLSPSARSSTVILLDRLGYVYFFPRTPTDRANCSSSMYGLGTFAISSKRWSVVFFFREAMELQRCFAFTLNPRLSGGDSARRHRERANERQHEGAAPSACPFQIFIKITLPQAMIVRSTLWQRDHLMIKGSRIVAIRQVFDLMGERDGLFRNL